MGCTNSVLYLVYSIYRKLLFSMHKEDYRTDLSKHVSINTQIGHNCLFKCLKYTCTILYFKFKMRKKCNFILLPSNQKQS